VGFENNFNDTTFHHHFCVKTGLSLGYSERDTSTVLCEQKQEKTTQKLWFKVTDYAMDTQ
jgi:hypothetical protein